MVAAAWVMVMPRGVIRPPLLLRAQFAACAPSCLINEQLASAYTGRIKKKPIICASKRRAAGA